MRALRLMMIVAIASSLAAPLHAQESVGVAEISVPEAAGRTVSATVWYPAQPGGRPTVAGGNAVFAGTEGRADAPPAEGRFPAVLVAHGGLRSADDSGAWIAQRLAAAGYVAVEVQGADIDPNDAAKAIEEVWRRPGDLSAALDALLQDPDLAGSVNADRIGAVGFFLSGTAVLSLAGWTMNPQAFAQTCEEPAGSPDCAWFASRGVDLAAVDASSLTRSRRDDRVASIIAVAPEYAKSFDADGLGDAEVPVRVVELAGSVRGADGGAFSPFPSNFDAASLEDASALDAFGLCTPKGAAILAEEGGDDALCRDGTGLKRTNAHEAIAATVLDHLERSLRIR